MGWLIYFTPVFVEGSKKSSFCRISPAILITFLAAIKFVSVVLIPVLIVVGSVHKNQPAGTADGKTAHSRGD